MLPSGEIPAAQNAAPLLQEGVSSFDLRKFAASQGLDVGSFQTDEQLASVLLRGLGVAAERDQQLATARKVQAMNQAYGQPPQQQATPNWQEYRQYLRKDEGGRIVPAPGAEGLVPWSVIQAAQAHQDRTQKHLAGLLEDPAKFAEENLAAIVEKRAREIVSEEMARRENEYSIDQYLNDNSGWMFTKDETGKEVLTAPGQRFNAILQQLTEAGVQPQHLRKMAETHLQAELHQELFDLRGMVEQQQQAYQAQQQQAEQQAQAYAAYQQQQLAAQQGQYAPQMAGQPGQYAPQQQRPQAPMPGQFRPQVGMQGGPGTGWQQPQAQYPGQPGPAPRQQPPQPSFVQQHGIHPGAWATSQRDGSAAVASANQGADAGPKEALPSADQLMRQFADEAGIPLN